MSAGSSEDELFVDPGGAGSQPQPEPSPEPGPEPAPVGCAKFGLPRVRYIMRFRSGPAHLIQHNLHARRGARVRFVTL